MSKKDDKLVEKIPKAVIDMLHRYHNDQTGDLPLREAFIEIYEAGRQELIKEIEEKMVEACPPTSTCGELFGIWEEDWKALKGGNHV